MRIADLCEAEGRSVVHALRTEGRSLRLHAGRAGLAAVALAAGAVFTSLGALLLLGAMYLWMQPIVGTAGATALMGLGVFVIGALLLWTAKSQLK